MPKNDKTKKKSYKVVLPASQIKDKDCWLKCLFCCCKPCIKNKKRVQNVDMTTDDTDIYYLL